MPSPSGKQQTNRESIENAITAVRQTTIDAFVNFLHTKENSVAQLFARRIKEAKEDQRALRNELISIIVEPEDSNSTDVTELRAIVGWEDHSDSFEGLAPEFLDVIYLLPPRDEAIVQSLLPIVDFIRALSPSEIGGLRLLDIGVGTGLLAAILDEMKILPGSYVGVDPAKQLADYARGRELTEGRRLTVEQAVVQDSKVEALKSSYDLILCHMVLHHVPSEDQDAEYHAALRAISECLNTGGIFIYTDKVFEGKDGDGVQIPLRVPKGMQERPSAFVPHPASLIEYHRHWIDDVADALFRAGLHIDSANAVTERVATYVCKLAPEPMSSIWSNFNSSSGVLDILNKTSLDKIFDENRNVPYQWLFECLRAFFKDITGEKCPPDYRSAYFLRGISYFSWECDSRIFLVRRAVPYPFHILSYSHVHDGWGALGQMVEDFEANPDHYISKTGYTCLTKDDLQRTLPFLGDIRSLNYEAAVAIPVYTKVDRDLQGAFLLFLHRHEHSPSELTTEQRNNFVKKCKKLSAGMEQALEWQADRLGIIDSELEMSQSWRELARDDNQLPVEERRLVIAELLLELQIGEEISHQDAQRVIKKVASKIQASLSTGDCFSVIEDDEIPTKIKILVAARKGIPFEELRGRILKTIGIAGEGQGAISFQCNDLYQKME